MIDLRANLNRIGLLRRPASAPRRFGRLRRAGLSSLGMAFSKGIQISVTVVTLPLMLHYLGENRFGVLMAITGLTQLFLLDVGLADAVKVRLIAAFAQTRIDEARSYVAAGFAGMGLLSAGLAALFFVIHPFVDWARVFHATSPATATEAERTLLVAMTLVFLMIPLRLVRDVYTADQRGYLYSLWLALATLLSLPAVLVVIGLDLGMPGLAVALHGAIAVGLLGSSVYLFTRDRPELRPRARSLEGFEWSTLLPSSTLFLIIGISLMTINGTDVFLVNYYLGGEDAAVFSFSARIFIYAHTFISFLTYPAWPALGDALASAELRWFTKGVRMLTIAVLPVSLLLTALLIAFGRQVILLWSGGLLNPPLTLLVLLGLYTVLRILTDLAGIVLRAMERIRLQAWVTLVEAVLHIGLGIVLMQRMGIVGMALGALVALLITRAWLLPLECWLAMRESRAASR